MKKLWAGHLPAERGESLTRLRMQPHIQVAECDDSLWLLGDEVNDSLESELRKIPDLELSDLTEDKKLLRWGCCIPSGKLPDTTWTPINSWVSGSKTGEPEPALKAST